ncbi:MAG: hypothetical protein WCF36_20450 [Candidatus Nanopelagicales bacterium]
MTETEATGQGPPDGADPRAWLQRLSAAADSLIDPPDFATLAGPPALRDAVRGCAVVLPVEDT